MGKNKTKKTTRGSGPMGGVEHTKGWKKRYAKKRRDEEKHWASLSGPVTIRHAETMDMRQPGESFCSDCPDHEACFTGWPCSLVKRVNEVAPE